MVTLSFTCVKLVMPSTKQIESSIFDLPVPLRPVMAVNSLSKPSISVRLPYDLKPSIINFLMYIMSLSMANHKIRYTTKKKTKQTPPDFYSPRIIFRLFCRAKTNSMLTQFNKQQRDKMPERFVARVIFLALLRL